MQATIQRLLDSGHTTPAYVQGRYMDVLAANPLAMAPSPMFSPGVNILRASFIDLAVQDLLPDWESRMGAWSRACERWSARTSTIPG